MGNRVAVIGQELGNGAGNTSANKGCNVSIWEEKEQLEIMIETRENKEYLPGEIAIKYKHNLGS